MLTESQQRLGKAFEAIAEDLDISPTDYARAVSSYQAVGSWLEDGFDARAYHGSHNKPNIYPQGSIRLGTVVRPLRDGKDPAYDVDLVCELQVGKIDASPENARAVKYQVGDRLKENATYRQKLDEEGRRCWTVEYAKDAGIGFHIDVLPCVPNPAQAQITETKYPQYPYAARQYAHTTIAITDKEEGRNPLYVWKSSNPNGFTLWFSERNVSFGRYATNQKQALFENTLVPGTRRRFFAEIASVPDELVHTPLQRAIQILKRTRDIQFKREPKYKPISMIITALAARLYDGEDDLFSAVNDIVRKLRHHAALLGSRNAVLHESVRAMGLIQRLPNDQWKIPNPVDPDENFADRWHEDGHARAKAFFTWVEHLQENLGRMLGETNPNAQKAVFSETFGDSEGQRAISLLEGQRGPSIAIAASVPHVEIRNPSRPWGNDV